MDGKTEYHGRLVEPIKTSKGRGDDEVEVQWGHNGCFEWVELDNIRVETSVKPSRRRSSVRSLATTTPNKKAAVPKAESSKKRKQSDTKMEKSTPVKGASSKPGSKASTTNTKSQKSTTRQTTKAVSVSPESSQDSRQNGESTRVGIPPTKRQKLDGEMGQNSVNGLFANFSAQAFSAKDAVINGFMGFYKSMVGS